MDDEGERIFERLLRQRKRGIEPTGEFPHRFYIGDDNGEDSEAEREAHAQHVADIALQADLDKDQSYQRFKALLVKGLDE